MNTENLSPQASGVTKAQLFEDFKVVVADAEALIRASAGQSGEALAKARARAEESLVAAKASLAEAQDAFVDKSKAAAKATDQYVHMHPWEAVGVAASVGVLVGLLIARR